MATDIQRTLQITAGNAETYCTAATLELNDSGYAFRLYMDSGTTGHAALNAAGMEALYPSATARPYQADSSMTGSRSSGAMSAHLQFDGANVHSESFTSTLNQTKAKTAITDAAVTGSTRGSSIRWEINGASTLAGYHIREAALTLYFRQYACAAQKAGNGVVSADVTDAAPYQGDSVTFTVELRPGAAWHGWYSDAACTQLVSAEQRYTTDAADLTLYARATVEGGTGLYVRTDGSYAEVQAVYKKINGVYVEQGDIAGLLDADARYVRAE